MPENQWNIVKRKDTSTKMGAALVSCLFPHDVLLKSNLSGGKRKVALKPGQKQEHYEALDPKIKQAIYGKVSIAQKLTVDDISLFSNDMSMHSYCIHQLSTVFYKLCTRLECFISLFHFADAVEKKFPTQFNSTVLGSAINNFLGKLRKGKELDEPSGSPTRT